MSSPIAFAALTTFLVCPSTSQTLPIQSATNPIECRVLVVNAKRQREDEGVDIDDFMASLELDDDFKKETSAARKWIAEEFPSNGVDLKALRLRAGYSQMQLAKEIEIHQPNISAIESGKRVPDRNTAKKLALALNVTVDDIYNALERKQG